MIHIAAVYPLMALLIAINLPLGYFRYSQPRHSFGWYFYLYLAAPSLVYFKIRSGLSWHHSLVLLGGLFVGQLLGSVTAHRQGREQDCDGSEWKWCP